MCICNRFLILGEVGYSITSEFNRIKCFKEFFLKVELNDNLMFLDLNQMVVKIGFFGHQICMWSGNGMKEHNTFVTCTCFRQFQYTLL